MRQNHLHFNVELGTSRGLHACSKPNHHIHISYPIRVYQALGTRGYSNCPLFDGM